MNLSNHRAARPEPHTDEAGRLWAAGFKREASPCRLCAWEPAQGSLVPRVLARMDSEFKTLWPPFYSKVCSRSMQTLKRLKSFIAPSNV